MRVFDYSVFDPIKDKWMKRIGIFKPIISKTFEDVDHDKMKMRGRRWGDNERVFQNAISFVSYKGSTPLSPEDTLQKIKTLDKQEIDEFIIKGLEDAAGADYWYTYEKDYG